MKLFSNKLLLVSGLFFVSHLALASRSDAQTRDNNLTAAIAEARANGNPLVADALENPALTLADLDNPAIYRRVLVAQLNQQETLPNGIIKPKQQAFRYNLITPATTPDETVDIG